MPEVSAAGKRALTQAAKSKTWCSRPSTLPERLTLQWSSSVRTATFSLLASMKMSLTCMHPSHFYFVHLSSIVCIFSICPSCVAHRLPCPRSAHSLSRRYDTKKPAAVSSTRPSSPMKGPPINHSFSLLNPHSLSGASSGGRPPSPGARTSRPSTPGQTGSAAARPPSPTHGLLSGPPVQQVPRFAKLGTCTGHSSAITGMDWNT